MYLNINCECLFYVTRLGSHVFLSCGELHKRVVALSDGFGVCSRGFVNKL